MSLRMVHYYKKHIQNILEGINKINVSKFIISIDGPGGSGKSTLAKELLEYVPDSFIVHMDDFYKQKKIRRELNSIKEIGGYFDWQRMEKQILIPFRENRDIKYLRYNWQFDTLKDWQNIPQSSNIVVEGVYSGRKELFKYYDLKIWIDCPYEIRLKRGVQRDRMEMKEYWQNVWTKQENEYLEKHKPFLSADFRINSDSD